MSVICSEVLSENNNNRLASVIILSLLNVSAVLSLYILKSLERVLGDLFSIAE
jgi:hypothetical protein